MRFSSKGNIPQGRSVAVNSSVEINLCSRKLKKLKFSPKSGASIGLPRAHLSISNFISVSREHEESSRLWREEFPVITDKKKFFLTDAQRSQKRESRAGRLKYRFQHGFESGCHPSCGVTSPSWDPCDSGFRKALLIVGFK